MVVIDVNPRNSHSSPTFVDQNDMKNHSFYWILLVQSIPLVYSMPQEPSQFEKHSCSKSEAPSRGQ